MINFLNKKIEFFYSKKIFLAYIFYVILILILSIIFGNKLILRIENLFDQNNNIILYNIPFGYGPLIENIYYGRGYFQIWNGVESYLVRFPFLPLFVTFISKISTNIYFFLFIKNLICFSIFFFCLLVFFFF